MTEFDELDELDDFDLRAPGPTKSSKAYDAVYVPSDNAWHVVSTTNAGKPAASPQFLPHSRCLTLEDAMDLCALMQAEAEMKEEMLWYPE